MIDHMGLTVSDFAAARAFYDRALAPLGASVVMTVPKEFTGGREVAGYGRDRPVFWLSEGERQAPPIHVAFTADSRAEVDAFYAAAMAAATAWPSSATARHGPPTQVAPVACNAATHCAT